MFADWFFCHATNRWIIAAVLLGNLGHFDTLFFFLLQHNLKPQILWPRASKSCRFLQQEDSNCKSKGPMHQTQKMFPDTETEKRRL